MTKRPSIPALALPRPAPEAGASAGARRHETKPRRPFAAFAAAIAAIPQTIRVRGMGAAADAARAIGRPGVFWPVLGLIGALVLWAYSLRLIDPGRIGHYGLVPLLPVPFYAALALLIVGFCLSVFRLRARSAVLAGYLVALVLVIHGTPVILYDHLRYSWAWKHVGIVDYIQRNGSVDPTIGLFNAYHNWPGFFAAAALLTEAAGFGDALAMASWAPVFFNLLFLAAVILIVQRFTVDRRLVWLSAWFFALTQWVGQDYFAPQPVAYVLYLSILVICLAWLGKDDSQQPVFVWTLRPVRRGLALVDRLLGPAAPEPPPQALSLRQQRAVLLIAILLFATIAVSHQLTPFFTILAVSALVAFDRCRVRGLPVLFVVLTLAWLSWGAVDYTREHLLAELEAFGQTEGNVASTLIDTSRADPSMRTVALIGRGLSGAVGVLAVLGGLRRLRSGARDLVPALLCASPILMLAGNSYGGEVVFRVYLFALPFLAFFAAGFVYPAPAAGRSWFAAGLSILLSGAMAGGLLFAYYGKEEMNRFTDGEVEATRFLYQIAPAESLIIEGNSTYPIRDRFYDLYSYAPVVIAADDPSYAACSYTVDELVDLMKDPIYPGRIERAPAAYFIATRSQVASIRLLGACSIDGLIEELSRHPCVETVFFDPDAVIMTIPPEPERQGACA